MRAIVARRIVIKPLLRRRWQKGALRAPFCCAAASNNTENTFKTRHSSTPATPTDAANAKLIKEKVWQKQAAPRKTIFPWRHETEPLERLVDPNIQGGVLGPGMSEFPPWTRHFFILFAASRLQVPWWQVFFTFKWRQELANACGFAFSQAVAGLLSNTYKVPFKETVSEDGGIDFCAVTEATNDDNNTRDNGDAQLGEKENPAETEDDTSPEIEYMMEQKLRKLYEAAHEFGKDQMQIRLQTEPIRCELVSLLYIPLLTRQAVHDKPSLRHAFRDLYREMESRRREEATDILKEFLKSRAVIEKGGRDMNIESTIICQVLIECDEVFSVTDVASGMVMQGNGEKQRVFHLVRLEAVVKERLRAVAGRGVQLAGFQLQSWQIVDWDDLEDGNIWYK